MKILDHKVVKNYAESIVSMCETADNWIPELEVIKKEAKTLLAYVQAPDLCGECRGLATECNVCGGKAYIATHVRGRKS